MNTYGSGVNSLQDLFEQKMTSWLPVAELCARATTRLRADPKSQHLNHRMQMSGTGTMGLDHL